MWFFALIEGSVIITALSNEEIKQEKTYLEKTSKEISKQIDILEKEIHVSKEQITEFKKILWEDKGSIDFIKNY